MADVTYGLRTIKKNLLDQPDLNLGASMVVPVPNTAARPESGQVVRLIEVNCEGPNARNIIASVGQFVNDGAVSNSNTNSFSSPITGIVEWGNGGTSAYMEFDIPQVSKTPTDPISIWSFGYPNVLVRSPRQSGVAFTIAASSIRISARNDNNLLATAETLATGGVIIGSRLSTVLSPTVFAHVAYGTSQGASDALLRKTIIMTTRTVQAEAACGIPPFARRVRFYRVGSMPDLTAPSPAPPVTVTFLSNSINNVNATYVIGQTMLAYSNIGPIDVPPGAAQVNVAYQTPAMPFYHLVAVFDLAI